MSESERPNKHYLRAATDLDNAAEGKSVKSMLYLATAAVHALLYIGNKIDRLIFELRVDQEQRAAEARKR